MILVLSALESLARDDEHHGFCRACSCVCLTARRRSSPSLSASANSSCRRETRPCRRTEPRARAWWCFISRLYVPPHKRCSRNVQPISASLLVRVIRRPPLREGIEAFEGVPPVSRSSGAPNVRRHTGARADVHFRVLSSLHPPPTLSKGALAIAVRRPDTADRVFQPRARIAITV